MTARGMIEEEDEALEDDPEALVQSALLRSVGSVASWG